MMAEKEQEITEDHIEALAARLTADGRLDGKERELLHRMVFQFKRQERKRIIPIEMLVDRIVSDAKLTRDELQELHDAVMADGVLSSEEWVIIQGIITRLTKGELQEV